MKTSNYLAKLPQEATIKSIQVLKDYDLISLDVPTASQRLCPHCGSDDGSSPFSGVSSLFTGVSCSFTSLFRRASLFPGVSPKLLIILVSTRFFWSSSLFSGVLYSCHQIFLKLHQLSLKLPITFIAMLDASIVVLNFQCYDWFATKNINLKEV